MPPKATCFSRGGRLMACIARPLIRDGVGGRWGGLLELGLKRPVSRASRLSVRANHYTPENPQDTTESPLGNATYQRAVGSGLSEGGGFQAIRGWWVVRRGWGFPTAFVVGMSSVDTLAAYDILPTDTDGNVTFRHPPNPPPSQGYWSTTITYQSAVWRKPNNKRSSTTKHNTANNQPLKRPWPPSCFLCITPRERLVSGSSPPAFAL